MNKIFARRHAFLWLPFLAAFSSTLRADQIVYDNALENGWQNWGWATLNYSNTSPVYTGCTYSISVTMTAWQGIQIWNAGFSDAPYASLSFWLNGGTSGGH